MTVQTVSYTMEVPKEIKDVIDLLDKVMAKSVAGDSVLSYATLLDDLKDAALGASKIKEEAKSQYRDEAAGYMVHKLLGTLLPVKPESPAAP